MTTRGEISKMTSWILFYSLFRGTYTAYEKKCISINSTAQVK